MKLNEKKLLEYLENHIGENTMTYDLAKDSGACEGMNDDQTSNELMEINLQIHEIAEKNGFRLNSHHRDNVQWGLPYVYDFYIELADVEKDVSRIMNQDSLMKRITMIQQEYGIYNDEENLLIGFRPSIPWQIKKIYDETLNELEETEK